MTQLFNNNTATTLSADITSSVTTISVIDGTVFPSPTGGDYFLATLDDGANIEVVKCTAVATNDLTVVRAHEGTAAAYLLGDQIEMRITADTLDAMSQKAAENTFTKTQSINKTTLDEPFVDFIATADADATSAISTFTTSGAVTHHIQIEINGVTAWIPCSTTDPTA